MSRLAEALNVSLSNVNGFIDGSSRVPTTVHDLASSRSRRD